MRQLGIVLAFTAASSAVAIFGNRHAQACGGCFHPPVQPTQTASDITDERMLLSVSPTQSTLYDQIRYAGSPSSFAWVLPIHGTVSVGLSADVLFDAVDALTATKITAPPSRCPAAPQCSGGGCGSSSSATGSAVAFGANEGNPNVVTVTKQENVGPYETVQLHATDASALNDWLTQNGFVIPSSVTPVLDEYVVEGFDFLAMKLLPNQGVTAMRPVRVSMPGASLSLPLRMAAIGTGASVGITIWIVADGRYEPQNFPFYRIVDEDLVWDWTTSSSNLTTLRTHNETALGQKGWEIESSLTLNQQTITGLILSGGRAIGGAATNPSEDYLPETDANAGVDAGFEGGVVKSAEEVRTADVTALFAGITAPNARVTRIRSDIAHAAMTVDLILAASPDQSELSNVRTVTQSVNEKCPIYSGCQVVGSGTPEQAAAGQSKSCAASARSSAGASTESGAIAGTLGLLLARALWARRASRKA